VCFAVAWLSLEPRRYRVALGDMTELTKTLAGTSPCFVSMKRVLTCLHANARLAGIKLPKRLTVDERDKPAYENWRHEIDLYREAAGARLARAKPARKRLLKA
jgi:hypothetical protein